MNTLDHYAAIIGIDWADNKHDLCRRLAGSEPLEYSLEAIFPVMPDTKYIDFCFVYEITSQIISDHQIANSLWIRCSFNSGAQQWKLFQLSNALQDSRRRFLRCTRILDLDELTQTAEIANRVAGIADIHLPGGLSSSSDPQLSSHAFISASGMLEPFLIELRASSVSDHLESSTDWRSMNSLIA